VPFAVGGVFFFRDADVDVGIGSYGEFAGVAGDGGALQGDVALAIGAGGIGIIVDRTGWLRRGVRIHRLATRVTLPPGVEAAAENGFIQFVAGVVVVAATCEIFLRADVLGGVDGEVAA